MQTDHYQTIYAQHAWAYDELIAAEDCEHNLLPAIRSICHPKGLRALDIGAGTGRCSRLLLASGVDHVTVTDASTAMLEVAQGHLEREYSGSNRSRWSITQADASTLPFPDASFDLAVAGWVYGHTIKWQPDTWQAAIVAAVAEARRVLTPQGRLIVFETLGTAKTEPAPPNEGMREYYALLQAQGFRQTVLATDYQFADLDTAVRVCGFFFGQTKADRIREHGWARVPEWTGMWVR